MKKNFSCDAGFLVLENMAKKFWNYWTINMDAICCTQKQLETLVYAFMEQEKLNREERKQFMDNILKQFREKHSKIYDIAAKNWDSPSTKQEVPSIDYWKALNQQMTRRWIENQEKYLEISQKARDSLFKSFITNPAEHCAELSAKNEVLLKQNLESQQKMWKMGKEAFQASVEYARQHRGNARPGEE